jgi:TRAP-type C4-dicarboxylate transport system substrate-binding protein
VRVLGFLDLGFRNVYNRVRDVKTPDDLKGLKIRVVPAPSYIAAYKALGVNTTPMAYTEVYQALGQGAIDGGEATAKQMVADRLMEVSKYYSFTRVTYNPIALLVSPRLFDGLSAADKELVQQAAKEALAYHSIVSRRMDQEAVVAMRQKGLIVSEPDTTPFERLLKPAVWEKLKGDIPNGTEVLTRLSAALEAASK